MQLRSLLCLDCRSLGTKSSGSLGAVGKTDEIGYEDREQEGVSKMNHNKNVRPESNEPEYYLDHIVNDGGYPYSKQSGRGPVIPHGKH